MGVLHCGDAIRRPENACDATRRSQRHMHFLDDGQRHRSQLTVKTKLNETESPGLGARLILTVNAEKVTSFSNLSTWANTDKKIKTKRTIKRTKVCVQCAPDELVQFNLTDPEREVRSVHVRAQNELERERRSFERVRVQHWYQV